MGTKRCLWSLTLKVAPPPHPPRSQDNVTHPSSMSLSFTWKRDHPDTMPARWDLVSSLSWLSLICGDCVAGNSGTVPDRLMWQHHLAVERRTRQGGPEPFASRHDRTCPVHDYRTSHHSTSNAAGCRCQGQPLSTSSLLYRYCTPPPHHHQNASSNKVPPSNFSWRRPVTYNSRFRDGLRSNTSFISRTLVCPRWVPAW